MLVLVRCSQVALQPALHDVGPHGVGKLSNCLEISQPFKAVVIGCRRDRDRRNAVWLLHLLGCGHFAHLIYRREHNTLSRR